MLQEKLGNSYYDFLMATNFMFKKHSLLILLSGTSGTGKSTLASLLGQKLAGLGNGKAITVFSTDSIRHILRNYVLEEEKPILFASTY